MPEFILDLGNAAAVAQYKDLDSFTQGYVEAMFFTSTGTGDDAENNLEHAHFGELAAETLASIIADCAKFQQENATLLEKANAIGFSEKYRWNWDDGSTGRDFWYTRNHHGVGYWDRGTGDIGDALTIAAQSQWCELSLYRGDDGKLYLQ